MIILKKKKKNIPYDYMQKNMRALSFAELEAAR